MHEMVLFLLSLLKTIIFSPGRGIPNVLAEGGCRVKLTADQLPTASQVADLYDQENHASLTRASVFGRDPFVDATEHHQAERRFTEAYSDITVLLDETVGGGVCFSNCMQTVQ